MKRFAIFLAPVWLLATAGCQTAEEPPVAEVPAVIIEPTAAGRAQLTRAVSQGLNDKEVTLSEDALTHTSVLLIERYPHRDARGHLLLGNDPGRPERFQLVKRGEQCILIHEAERQRWPLDDVRCQAE